MRVASAVVRGFALGAGPEAMQVLDAWNAAVLAALERRASSRTSVHEAMRVGALPWGKMLLADDKPATAPSVAIERRREAARRASSSRSPISTRTKIRAIRIGVDLHRVVDQAVEALASTRRSTSATRSS
jgi:hypothetical protein